MSCTRMIFSAFGKVRVGGLFENESVIDGGAPLGDFNMPPALKRREQHEQVGRAVAPVFVVHARRARRFHRHRQTCFDQKLLAGFVETKQRA